MEDSTPIQADTTEVQEPGRIFQDTEINKKISDVEYVATGYCGLCRTQLPHNPLPVVETRSEEWQQWEGDLRAGLDITSNENRNVE